MAVRYRLLGFASVIPFSFLTSLDPAHAASAAANGLATAQAAIAAIDDGTVDCGDPDLIAYCNREAGIVVEFADGSDSVLSQLAANRKADAAVAYSHADCCYCASNGGDPRWAVLCPSSSSTSNTSSSSTSTSSETSSSVDSSAPSSSVSSVDSSSSETSSSASDSSVGTSQPSSSSASSDSSISEPPSSSNSSGSSVSSVTSSTSSSLSSIADSSNSNSSADSSSSVSSSVSSGSSSSGDTCPPESPDPECINPGLDPEACANANGFLGQVNIASVLNLQATPLGVRVEYRDAAGTIRGTAQATIASNLKRDFIVNDLGLQPDSYGTVCVRTDAQTSGQWLGGVTFYKANQRNGQMGYDFALYEPFMNPITGAYTLPLNTFHLGTDPTATVANWVRITDAVLGDGLGLNGTLVYYNDQGLVVGQDDVSLADGGRFDYSAHEKIGGPENRDAVGMARFVARANPDGSAARYYITSGRYFYDCFGASCPNFLTAFTMPYRPPTSNQLAGDVSTKDGISIIELNNVGSTNAEARIGVHASSGALAGTMTMPVPPLGTRHVIINRVGEQGFLAENTVGAATVNSAPGFLSSLTLFYKLDKDTGRLLYGAAAPFAASPGEAQISEFNSFIQHINRSWLYNSSTEPLSAQIAMLNFDGRLLGQQQFDLPAAGSTDLTLAVPADTYGTLIINASRPGLVFRNYTSRTDEYLMTFIGK